MTTSIEARYLSGNDLGKTLTVDMGEPISGIIGGLGMDAERISIYFEQPAEDRQGTFAVHITPDHLVTITGTPTPPGLNLHRSVLDQDG